MAQLPEGLDTGQTEFAKESYELDNMAVDVSRHSPDAQSITNKLRMVNEGITRDHVDTNLDGYIEQARQEAEAKDVKINLA